MGSTSDTYYTSIYSLEEKKKNTREKGNSVRFSHNQGEPTWGQSDDREPPHIPVTIMTDHTEGPLGISGEEGPAT